MQIFISYRRSDAKDVAGRIDDSLRQYFGEDEVFRDVSDIHAGDDFLAQLEQVLAHCRAMIVIIGEAWISERLHDPNDFVRVEVECALKRSIPLIPVLVGNALMPSAQELPASLESLTRIQALPVRSGVEYHDNIRRLCLVLQEKVDSLVPIAAKHRRRLRRNTGIFGLVGIALLGTGFSSYRLHRVPTSQTIGTTPSASRLPDSMVAVASASANPVNELTAGSSAKVVSFFTKPAGARVLQNNHVICQPTPCEALIDGKHAELEIVRTGYQRHKHFLAAPFPEKVELYLTKASNAKPKSDGDAWIGDKKYDP